MSDIEALRTLVNTYNMMGDRMRLGEMGALFGERTVCLRRRIGGRLARRV